MDNKEKLLNSPIKVKILKLFNEGGAEISLTFKDIKDSLNISTDSLKFQLNDLVAEGILSKKKNKYNLTNVGKELLKEIKEKGL
ncbi:winged helix-turn-helix domain-containing protein [Stygiolobus caldivivus]|uniref:ArnR1-like winged helix-turn-helix domain-containing protein n=1 Tax=Stygiolobus caldivivus TaxID=2824673 RepID=A0A8D5U8D0_9CREN|nr:winged helix-turn-helix domain-containing protein [Stygiolobus caldivivus]BCU71501.1 hypothetical protein KN1_27980 [Stygiolobus caldivivus]